jgi:hypothetical protein
LLDEYIAANITISYKPIPIGRKEFEDWMLETQTVAGLKKQFAGWGV